MPLRELWARRQATKFNGVPYVVQRAAAAVHSPEGRKQTAEQVAYYMENARRLREGLGAAGFSVFGGEHAPYIWMRTPSGLGVVGVLRPPAARGARRRHARARASAPPARATCGSPPSTRARTWTRRSRASGGPSGAETLPAGLADLGALRPRELHQRRSLSCAPDPACQTGRRGGLMRPDRPLPLPWVVGRCPMHAIRHVIRPHRLVTAPPTASVLEVARMHDRRARRRDPDRRGRAHRRHLLRARPDDARRGRGPRPAADARDRR